MRFEMCNAPCNNEQMWTENDLRVSVITARIIRVEKAPFTDLRTQFVMCRNFDKPQFNITNTANKVIVVTKSCVFEVDKKTLKVNVLLGGTIRIETPDCRKNLGGTARTLDGTFGILGSWKSKREKKDHFCIEHMRRGLFASNGVVEIDDSKSFLLNFDGSVSMRNGGVDKYILAFGKDYLGGLKEYYALTGYTPVLPKFALGNWWSRYHAYTQDEYLELMDKFEEKNIPLSVATIDMDWHIVKNVPKDVDCKTMQGAGWTGYTFEKELFPDYKAFLKDLKNRNLAITMNLHPKDGVRYFEEQYEQMAKACDIDPATKQTVEFDLTSEKFLNAYFDILHHPYEKDGVDFWWIDWQQGTKSKMQGLDPLWLLNHYHTLDNCREGRKGLILSRYSGLGSHRYPLGFSGDTFVCWRSLNFQPYFTALASNAAYTWWSHDIGGHLFGHGDNELYLRWLQYGVFSPINRLHSNNKSMSKEPWNYQQVESIAEDFLRMRHRLLPYIYSANIRTAKEGIPLISPLYYYNNDDEAYNRAYRNQYYFGEQMLVAPVTHKGKDGVATKKVWLPNGEWIHFFTGEEFEGGRVVVIDCPLDEIPVFVKKGSIIVMLANRDNNSQEYDNLCAKVYLGECKYDLHDENACVHFEMKECDCGYQIDMTVDGENKTQSIEFELVGVSGATVQIGEKIVDCDKTFVTSCVNQSVVISNIKR